jgi:hypothetical protein
VGRRRDVRTLEALAWTLQVNGRASEAKTEMDKAVAVGIRTAASFYHAGTMAAATGDATAARKCWEQSLSTCGTSAVADAARTRLEGMTAEGIRGNHDHAIGCGCPGRGTCGL